MPVWQETCLGSGPIGTILHLETPRLMDVSRGEIKQALWPITRLFFFFKSAKLHFVHIVVVFLVWFLPLCIFVFRPLFRIGQRVMYLISLCIASWPPFADVERCSGFYRSTGVVSPQPSDRVHGPAQLAPRREAPGDVSRAVHAVAFRHRGRN